jgi:AraC-like DNA-binding protein
MEYLKFHPCKELEPFVECYYVWQSGNEPVTDLVIESPPNGFCAIVFNSGDPYFLQNKKYDRLPVPKEFVAGLSIYSYKLFLNGNISVAGIVFKPAGLATLFNLPVYEYTEERIDLRKVFMPFVIEKYAGEIATATAGREKAKWLEDFVLKFYEANKPEPDYIDEAANKIVDSNGMLNVNDLLENIYMSRRNFERRFFKKVGLSPKYYARIRRIGYSLSLVIGKKKVDWSKVFSDCEFYDKSHFIKDFLEFTGRTPQQYLEENKELANLVEKPKEQPLN